MGLFAALRNGFLELLSSSDSAMVHYVLGLL